MAEGGAPTCALCGLPVGRSRAEERAGGVTLRFCCEGCRHVYRVLAASPGGFPENPQETDLFRACMKAGIIPLSDITPDAPRPGQSAPDPASTETTLRVSGMVCPACAWLVSEILGRAPGVLGVSVRFHEDAARIRYLPALADLSRIAASLSPFGYVAAPLDDTRGGASERRRALLRLGVAAILSANVMMLSFSLYVGFFEDLGAGAQRFLTLPMWALATPVVFWCGLPILRRAAFSARALRFEMDTLIAAGALAAYGAGVLGAVAGSLHVYFDTASMLVTLVLFGRAVEATARGRVNEGLSGLARLAAGKARVVSGDRRGWVSAESVAAGERFRVLAGERVPADGAVVSGEAEADLSILTGEPRPARLLAGGEALAGALLLSGSIECEASRPGAESVLFRAVSSLREALAARMPVEDLADRVTARLVPAIFLLAVVAAALGASGGAGEAIMRAVTVLVIACPCALGLATPLARVAAVGEAARRGILIRDPSVIEAGSRATTVVFDKTGTLTEGAYLLRAVTTADGCPEAEALRVAAALEAHSGHHVAREIARRAREAGIGPAPAEDVREEPGLGVRGVVSGRRIALGNARLLAQAGCAVPEALAGAAARREAVGETVIYLGWGGAAQAFFAFGDALREGARETVSTLRGRGLEPWLVSGDSDATTSAVAQGLGISEARGRLLPHEKAALVSGLREAGARVVFVGDGVNDAPALAAADAGFAVATGAAIARGAAAVTIPSAAKAPEALALFAKASRVVRWNLGCALVYNLVAIPVAMTGLLNPLVAVCAMFASSLTVIGNTLRIRRP